MGALAGLVDFAGLPEGDDYLQVMAESVPNRSVGGIGYCSFERGGFAISATSGHQQPLKPLRRGDLHLVADARIDNGEELCRALAEELGGREATHAELILAAYRRWGIDCVEVLLGDFVFAIWDGEQQRLFAARDQLGVRGLCFTHLGPLICFASEAQQLLSHPAVSNDLDDLAVADFLCGHMPAKDRTFFRQVRALPPGHRLIASHEGVRVERYWDIDPEHRVTYQKSEEYAEHFASLLEQSVAARLVGSAGQVGIAMSGGLDSCSVAAVARRVVGVDGSPGLVAGSFVFGTRLDCDESPYIRTMTSDLGLQSVEIQAERRWYLAAGDSAFSPSLESPFLPVWEGCYEELTDRLRERGIDILLTGHGGDELLCGSPRVYADRLRRRDGSAGRELAQHARRVKLPLSRAFYGWMLRPLLPPTLDRFLRRLAGRSDGGSLPAWIAPDFARRTNLEQRLEGTPSGLRFLEHGRQDVYDTAVGFGAHPYATQWYERRPRRQPLDVRHPYLDRRLVEFVLSIPSRELISVAATKPLLRNAMLGYLPESVRQRAHKTRLGRFVDLGLRDMEAMQVRSLLQAPLAEELGYIDGARLRVSYEQYRKQWPSAALRAVVNPILFELWLRSHYDSLLTGQTAEPRRLRSGLAPVASENSSGSAEAA